MSKGIKKLEIKNLVKISFLYRKKNASCQKIHIFFLERNIIEILIYNFVMAPRKIFDIVSILMHLPSYQEFCKIISSSTHLLETTFPI